MQVGALGKQARPRPAVHEAQYMASLSNAILQDRQMSSRRAPCSAGHADCTPYVICVTSAVGHCCAWQHLAQPHNLVGAQRRSTKASVHKQSNMST
jgi:hypothetical protein